MDKTKKNNPIVTALFVFLLIPFFSISSIRDAVSTSLYQVWQGAAAIFFFMLVITAAAEIKINWAVGLFGLYQAVILLSTFLNQGFSSGILVVTLAALLLFMLLQTRFYRMIVSAICWIVLLSAVINLPVMLPKLSDETANFFIGGKNALGIFLVPGCFLLMLHSLNEFSKIDKKTIAAVVFCLLSVFIAFSGTGAVVAAAAIALTVPAFKLKPPKKYYILALVLLYATFICFGESFFESTLWRTFTEFLGKESTLTSRTAIWSAAKEVISENWLFGSGRGTPITYVSTWGMTRTIREAHNFVLEILLEGGFFAFALYFSLLAKAVALLDLDDMKNRIVFIALCVLLINGLTESTLNNFFVIIMLGIACRYAAENRGKLLQNEQPLQKT